MGNRWRYGIVALALAVACVVFRYAPGPIRFGQFSAAQFTQQLTPLFLVALLIERSLEVFLTTLRGPEAANLQRKVDKATQFAAADPTQLPKVQEAQDALATYKSVTQQIAMPVALVLGLLISAIGVRCLGNLVADNIFKDHPLQKEWFTCSDVLLTGALVGGGSDFVHQFITSLTDFINKSNP